LGRHIEDGGRFVWLEVTSRVPLERSPTMSDGASAAATKNPAAPDPMIGRVINERFKVTGVIAKGGMGKVYRAEQAPLGRVCAVKVLNPSYSGSQDPEFHKRFFLEASIASKLTHPNTVTIFDYGKTADDIYFMAMEYLEGRTLHRAIREATFFPEARAVHVARQVCRALREAHGIGVIHRDLKPANIFLVEHGDEVDFVKLLDFGLVKRINGDGRGEELTQAGLFMGSPKYMAPEQIRGERVDTRTDVYALGIILYEMVTGKVPFDRSSSVQILMAHVHDAPPPLRQTNPRVDVSQALEDLIARCTSKNPDERFASMDEIIAALKVVAPPSSVQSTPHLPPQPPSGSGAHALPNPTGSGAVPTPGPSESGAKAISPVFSLPVAPAPAAAPPPRAPPRASSMYAGVAIVAAVAGLGGYFGLRHGSADAKVAAAPVASAVAAPAPAPPPPESIVKVRISSDPDGAIVKENGVAICASTPCDVLYADADPARVHELTVTLAGYHAETKGIRVGDSPILVKLTPQ
jgi:serine/threonine-protein kinase